MRVAVIPARGGSKRIPRKNIKKFCDKPMIAYSIEVAKSSGLFTHVVVSTDDAEITSLAQDLGAEVPFMRPPDLADDHTPTAPVISHSATACEALGWKIEYVCCIYPCAPFLQKGDLSNALTLLENSPSADYSFPVTEFTSAIQRALLRDASGRMKSFSPEFEMTRTQDLVPAYHDAGQFYWGRPSAWHSNHKIHNSGVGLVIPNWRVVDIDTPEDWIRAEAAFNLYIKNK
jgi:pseudaminic acid cytidylyltransferase